MIHTMFVRRRAARAGLSGATSIFGACLLLALVALASLWPREAVAGGSVTGCTLTHTFNASPLNVAQRYDLTPADAAACSPNGDIQKDSGATAVGSGGSPGDTISGQHGTYTLEYDGGGAEWILYTPTSSASGGYNESFSFYGDDGGSVYNNTANITILSSGSAPDAPTIGTATASNGQATITFSPPGSDGGSPITGYTATSNPDGKTGTCSASPCTVTGLTNGTAYTFTVTATNANGTSTPSSASNSVTPQASQTITFANPGPQNFGTTPTLSATASSGQPVTFTSSTTSVCTITSGGSLTTVSAGTCTILADQGGNGAFQPAPQFSQSFAIVAVAPGAPTIGAATAGDGQALVNFTPPAFNGGATITQYTATSDPGSLAGSCATSPCVVTGLVNGIAYTFTVTATNSAGTGVPSTASTSVTPQASQTITFANPGPQNFGTTPTLSTTASSGQPVTFTSSTTSVCTITSGGLLTTVSTGTCTILANQGGNGAYQPAPQVSQSFAIVAVAPGAPTIGTATAGDGQALVSFTPPAFTGGATITGYTVTSSPGGLATPCALSPCTVTGLSNGTAYAFTVMATNSAGTGTASGSSNSVTPKASQDITNFMATPANPVYSPGGTFHVSATGGGSINPVVFAIDPSSSAVCSISGATVTMLSAGTCTVTANQAGDAGHVAAPQVTLGVIITNPPAPTTSNVNASTAYNTVTSIDLSSAIGGSDITSVTIGTMPSHGTAVVSGETVTYTPASTFYGGTDTFTYTATNPGGTSAPATVTVTVGTPAAPTAAAKSATTPYDTAAAIDLSGSITGVNITAVAIGTVPAHGTVSVSGETVTYTPASSYYGGTDTFTYTATNPGGTSAPATVTVTVGKPAAPAAANKTATTPYNTAATIDLSGSITGVDVTTITIGTAPSHGTASVSGETVTYTPASSYYGGTDTFTYTATNPGGTSAPATVTVTVGKPGTPTVAAKSATTPYNTAATIDLSGSITGVDITAVAISTAPTHGTVSVSGKSVTYTPASTYYGGTDIFAYTATNPGGTSTSATVTVTVGKPAVPTVAAKSVTTPYDTATAIDLSGSITGVDITAVAIGTAPTHGTVSVSGKTVTYTPASTYYGGTDTFTYTATNPGGTSTPATVTVTVKPLSVPVVQPLTVSTTTGASVQIQAAAGASGPKPFTGASVAQAPTHGQAQANGEQITYTPAAGFVGTDHFTYEIANHFGNSAPAVVTVTVTPTGQASAPDGTVTVMTKPGVPVTVDLASIVPGQYASSVLLGVSPGDGGHAAIGQPTALTFTPATRFHGLAQITAMLTTADGHTKTVDVLVLVNTLLNPSHDPDVLGLINAQTAAAQRFAQSQLDNIRQRLESLHDGDDRLFSSNLSLSLDGQSLQGPRMGAARSSRAGNRYGPGSPGGTAPTTQPVDPQSGIGSAGDGMGMMSPDDRSVGSMALIPGPGGERGEDGGGKSGAGGSPGRGPSGLGVWIDGTAAFGSYHSYRQSAGFDADSMAINVGADERIGERGLFGMSLGYNHDRSTISNDGTRSIAQGYSAALYGSFTPSAKTYLDAVLGGGGLSFDSRRRDADTGGYLLGHRNGDQWFGSLTGGYEYHYAKWLVSPYGRLEWSYSSLNGFSENGDVADALSYGRQSVRTSLAVLGLRASGMIQTQHAVLVPRARLEVGHDFQGTSNTTLSYAFVPSAGSWNVLTNPYSANGTSVEAGLGMDFQLRNDLRLTTDYDFLKQPHSHSQTIRFGLNKKF